MSKEVINDMPNAVVRITRSSLRKRLQSVDSDMSERSNTPVTDPELKKTDGTSPLTLQDIKSTSQKNLSFEQDENTLGGSSEKNIVTHEQNETKYSEAVGSPVRRRTRASSVSLEESAKKSTHRNQDEDKEKSIVQTPSKIALRRATRRFSVMQETRDLTPVASPRRNRRKSMNSEDDEKTIGTIIVGRKTNLLDTCVPEEEIIDFPPAKCTRSRSKSPREFQNVDAANQNNTKIEKLSILQSESPIQNKNDDNSVNENQEINENIIKNDEQAKKCVDDDAKIEKDSVTSTLDTSQKIKQSTELVILEENDVEMIDVEIKDQREKVKDNNSNDNQNASENSNIEQLLKEDMPVVENKDNIKIDSINLNVEMKHIEPIEMKELDRSNEKISPELEKSIEEKITPDEKQDIENNEDIEKLKDDKLLICTGEQDVFEISTSNNETSDKELNSSNTKLTGNTENSSLISRNLKKLNLSEQKLKEDLLVLNESVKKGDFNEDKSEKLELKPDESDDQVSLIFNLSDEKDLSRSVTIETLENPVKRISENEKDSSRNVMNETFESSVVKLDDNATDKENVLMDKIINETLESSVVKCDDNTADKENVLMDRILNVKYGIEKSVTPLKKRMCNEVKASSTPITEAKIVESELFQDTSTEIGANNEEKETGVHGNEDYLKKNSSKKQQSVIILPLENDKSSNFPKTPIPSKSINRMSKLNLDTPDKIYESLIELSDTSDVRGNSKPEKSLKVTKKVLNLSSESECDAKEKDDMSQSIQQGNFARSWSQSIKGKGDTMIDAFGKKERTVKDVSQHIEKKNIKSKKDEKKIDSNEDEEDEDEKEYKLAMNEFVDNEAEEGDNDSMDSEERQYLKENEIPEIGESIGSEDTEEDENIESENDEVDSFIVSDDDEIDNESEQMSTYDECESENSVAENEKMSKTENSNKAKCKRQILSSSDDEDEKENEKMDTVKDDEGEEIDKEEKSSDKLKQKSNRDTLNKSETKTKIVKSNKSEDENENEINTKIQLNATMSDCEDKENENSSNEKSNIEERFVSNLKENKLNLEIISQKKGRRSLPVKSVSISPYNHRETKSLEKELPISAEKAEAFKENDFENEDNDDRLELETNESQIDQNINNQSQNSSLNKLNKSQKKQKKNDKQNISQISLNEFFKEDENYFTADGSNSNKSETDPNQVDIVDVASVKKSKKNVSDKKVNKFPAEDKILRVLNRCNIFLQTDSEFKKQAKQLNRDNKPKKIKKKKDNVMKENIDDTKDHSRTEKYKKAGEKSLDLSANSLPKEMKGIVKIDSDSRKLPEDLIKELGKTEIKEQTCMSYDLDTSIEEQIVEKKSKLKSKSLKRKLSGSDYSDEYPSSKKRNISGIIRTASGIFFEEPVTPKKSQKDKKILEFPWGAVIEESIIPKSKKNEDFAETNVTPKSWRNKKSFEKKLKSDENIPKSLSYKMKKALSAGQIEPPILEKGDKKNKIKKHNLKISEPNTVLPRPIWIKSDEFQTTTAIAAASTSKMKEISVAESCVTGFYVKPLKAKKRKLEADEICKEALEFKKKILRNDNVVRETSKDLLRKKEKQRFRK